MEEAYRRSGFAGGLNYYRNIDRNWELMAPYADQAIRCPTLFIAGTKDNALARASRDELDRMMAPRVPGLQMELLEGYGHWIQQEAPEAVNEAMLNFLARTTSDSGDDVFRSG